MTNHEDFASGAGEEYGSAPGHPPRDADREQGPLPGGARRSHRGASEAAPGYPAYDQAPGYGEGPGHRPGHPAAGPYGQAPGGPGGGSHRGRAETTPGPTPAPDGPYADPRRAYGIDQGGQQSGDYVYGAPYDDGAYRPEPPGNHGEHLPRTYGEHPPGAPGGYGDPLPGAVGGYGGPSDAQAWGHSSAQDPYAPPVPSGDGWSPAPAAAHPWAAQPDHAYEAQQAQPRAYEHTALPQTQDHTALPQSYEHTALLPVLEEFRDVREAEASGPEAGTPQPAPAPRTGSPIIPPGIQPAALTAALGLLLAGGAAVGKPGLAVILVVLEAVTAAGWFRLNGMWPARQGIVLAFLAGVTADIALLAADGSHGPAVLLGTLGVWLLLVLVLQLRHHGSADERLSSLTATSASTLLTVVAAGYLATATSHAGSDPVAVGVIAVAAATVVRALRLPGGGGFSVVLSLLAAGASGYLTGGATDFGSFDGVLLALAAGLCAVIGLRVASYDFPSRFVHFTAGVALPLTAAAPIVYILGTALN
ncbi:MULTISPECIES: hypothetical protein [unclassified Streptomyces]|uniref:hypothetical protein n=1 Tax=unclassified Streptomyces TaxID=2593676 RepID=UPI002E2BE9F0|nr:hypothetical protein [Streptomyces sp. NBC_00223]